MIIFDLQIFKRSSFNFFIILKVFQYFINAWLNLYKVAGGHLQMPLPFLYSIFIDVDHGPQGLDRTEQDFDAPQENYQIVRLEGYGAKNLALFQNQCEPSLLGKLINFITWKMVHTGKNYSIKLWKYYFCTTTQFRVVRKVRAAIRWD